MDKNIYITGFMGVGKSTIARDLAKYLVWKCVDLDAEVEKLGKYGLNQITEHDGLQAVRKLEQQALEMIGENSNQVVALGAGTLLRRENLNLVKDSGVLVYLSAEITTLTERLIGDTSKERPLFGKMVTAVQNGIAQNPKLLAQQIAELLRERLPTYVKADFRIVTDGKTIREITIETEKRLRLREQQAVSS